MRKTTAVSLTVIALALAAIVGGFASGQAGARPPQTVALQPLPSPGATSHPRAAGYSDSTVDDLFSDDDVVVQRAQKAHDAWLPPRLSVVVGLAGESLALDGEFLRSGLPVAFDLDPHASDAARVAQYVTEERLVLLIHVNQAPSPRTLRVLQKRFGRFDGIASQETRGMAHALQGTKLLFFDERGDGDPAAFADDGVRFIARDARVDDHSSPGYIRFMLERAAMRSQREGRLVILMRPLPNSLAALSQFLGTRSAEIVALTQPRS
ncbi:MAG TPA: divergent polysaccharide deacetylase family protein [Candidatus Aquilonibacter sp.]|nr:divergent polysaccharide deacetylase family protein [Candidatus Aquilonibacter sp.]